MPSREPDVWTMLFEQTPTIVRWLLGVLTMGLFTLGGVIYKINKRDMEKLNGDIDGLRRDINGVREQQNQIYRLLITRGSGHDS